MKKQPMAEAAEQLLAGTGWLPTLLRTAPPPETAGGSVEDIGATEESEGFPEAAE
jgi:ParB family chromosome partitioning protein